MIRKTLTLSVAIALIAPAVGQCQWYVNPQQQQQANQASGGANPGNVAMNGMLYGANGLISGNGITPGGGVLPTAAATVTDTGGASGDGGGSNSGYSFTSDPVSAYESAVDNGMANVIRAQGDYNRKTAKAMTEYEIARAAYVENQGRIFNFRRSLLRSTLQARADDMEERSAQRVRAEAFLASHRPPPLSDRQLDPSTAELRWPPALMDSDFDEDRKSLDELLQTHMKPGTAADVSTDIKKRIHDLQIKLHEHILKLDLQDYSDARQFLDRMAITAHRS